MFNYEYIYLPVFVIVVSGDLMPEAGNSGYTEELLIFDGVSLLSLNFFCEI